MVPERISEQCRLLWSKCVRGRCRDWSFHKSKEIYDAKKNIFTTFDIQISIVIRGGYVSSFQTANLEFTYKKSISDLKSVILDHFFQCEKVNSQIKSLQITWAAVHKFDCSSQTCVNQDHFCPVPRIVATQTRLTVILRYH